MQWYITQPLKGMECLPFYKRDFVNSRVKPVSAEVILLLKIQVSLSQMFIQSPVQSPRPFPISVTFQFLLIFVTSAESWSSFLCSQNILLFQSKCKTQSLMPYPMATLNARLFHGAKLSWRSRVPKASAVSTQHEENYSKPHSRPSYSWNSSQRQQFLTCPVTPYSDQSHLSLQ